MQDNKVIAITQIQSCFEFMLRPLVQLIHVYICKELARNVTEWEAFTWHCFKTFDYAG